MYQMGQPIKWAGNTKEGVHLAAMKKAGISLR